MPPTVRQPAARIGVNSAEQRLERIEESDDENGCAKRFEVFRRKTEPEPLATPSQYQHDKQQRGIASQSQEVGKVAPAAHVAV